MRRASIISFLFCMLQSNYTDAQASASPVGEYYLTGVMETACGFKLEQDSSFQFYFSYGALDRQGSGRWRVENNSILFNSEKKPSQDFALIRSSPGANDKLTIQLKEENTMFLNHVFCKIKGDGKAQEAMTNETGIAEFTLQPVDSIELIFEFCPEKKSAFAVNGKEQHHFEFRAEPWLMDVFFADFRLNRTKEGLAGGHPFAGGKTFRYVKRK